MNLVSTQTDEYASPICVLVISGASGAGKTALVRSVAEMLHEAATLHFDDYAKTSTFPADLSAWTRSGADPNLWRTPQMVNDLRALRSGKTVRLPDTGKVVEPRPFLVVEEPFGRSRREIADLMDFVVFLNVPLETALARKLLRDLDTPSLRSEPRRSVEYARDFLGRYLHSIRDLYRAVNRQAAQNSDLILDGERPLQELTQEIVSAARAKRSVT